VVWRNDSGDDGVVAGSIIKVTCRNRAQADGERRYRRRASNRRHQNWRAPAGSNCILRRRICAQHRCARFQRAPQHISTPENALRRAMYHHHSAPSLSPHARSLAHCYHSPLHPQQRASSFRASTSAAHLATSRKQRRWRSISVLGVIIDNVTYVVCNDGQTSATAGNIRQQCALAWCDDVRRNIVAAVRNV